jgi:hypothetical protein
LSGNLKLDRKKFVIFLVFIVSQIVIVAFFHRENFTKLILYFGSTLFYILPFVSKKSYDVSHKSYNRLFLFLLVAVFGYGLAQHLTGYFPWDRNWNAFSSTGMNLGAISNTGTFIRVYSCFSGLQEFASFIIFTVFLLWIYACKFAYKLILMLFLLAGLYIAGAKSVIFALLAAALIYFFRKLINPLLLFIVVYILPYIILVLIYHIFRDDMTDLFYKSEGGLFHYASMYPRLEIAYSFFTSFQPKNWLGEGAGCASVITDNMFIRILMEYGIVGFIAFMFFLWTIFRQLFYISVSVPHQSKEEKIISSKENMFFLLLFFVLTISFHTGELLHSRHSILLFMFVAIGVNEKYKKIKKYETNFLCAN